MIQENLIFGYTSLEIVIMFFGMMAVLVGCILFIQVSHLYKRRRLKSLLKVARITLKRDLTINEMLIIRTAYYHLDYSEVLDIISGVYQETGDAK